ncbi:hypothetical protein [Microbacterium sp. P02]|uniref:hypothetical protein n=1 Tax=Microbacterium sp. P02 TaxID=3366260 RepID=UPI0036714772
MKHRQPWVQFLIYGIVIFGSMALLGIPGFSLIWSGEPIGWVMVAGGAALAVLGGFLIDRIRRSSAKD